LEPVAASELTLTVVRENLINANGHNSAAAIVTATTVRPKTTVTALEMIEVIVAVMAEAPEIAVKVNVSIRLNHQRPQESLKSPESFRNIAEQRAFKGRFATQYSLSAALLRW
jgi:hypothetical protein